MKMLEIRKLKTEELAKQTTQLRAEIVDMKRKLAQGETTNVRTIRNKRKDLARMLTVLSEQLMKEKM